MAQTPKQRVNRMSEAESAERSLPNAEPSAQPANQASDPANRVAELQVSAHIMTLETGLFCVFQTPGCPACG
jgi:hypothetical protein